MTIIIVVIEPMKKKNYMFVIAVCAITFGTFASITYASEPSVPQAGDILEVLGDITMPGQAQMETTPDLIVISLRIESRDSSAETAKNHVATIIERVIRALKQLGLVDKEIETMGYNIQPQYEWQNKKQIFKGYLVSCSLAITVKDTDTAGKAIDASVNAGALINSINFQLSQEKQDAIKKQLLTEATLNAKEKANDVMVALGQHLGRATSVSMNAEYQPYKYLSGDQVYSMSVDSVPTTVMSKDLTVSVTVTIAFEILP